ncbi:MAG: lysophospholipid acyltransferase family protein [Gammaproteobacteria bacterium]
MILIRTARTALRSTRLVIHLLIGVILASVLRLTRGQAWYLQTSGQALVRWWMQRASKIIGLHIDQYGTPVKHNVLLVCNHISFLDILAISSAMPVRFLAKHDIRSWPVIGYLSALSGSLFIERGKHHRLRQSLITLRHALTQPVPVLIFPEGTTSDGRQVLQFHTGLFQAALDKQVAVQALTLHYRHHDQSDRLAAYIEDDNFLLNLLRLMGRDKTEVHLSFTPAIDTQGHNRRRLAAFCHARISQNLAYQLHYQARDTGLGAVAQFGILDECQS